MGLYHEYNALLEHAGEYEYHIVSAFWNSGFMNMTRKVNMPR